MSVTNAQRHDLHSRLEEVLGPERAEILMDYLPPVGWADVATKSDLGALEERLGLRLKNEIGGLRSEFRQELAEGLGGLRSEFGGLRAEVRQELAEGLGDLRSEFGDLRTEFSGLRSEVGGLRSEFGGLRSEFGDLRSEFGDLRSGFVGLAGKIDVETANRKKDIEEINGNMARLQLAILREQRVHLVVMVTVLSAVMALINLLG